MENLSCGNVIQVQEKVKLYECKPEIVERVVLFITQNFTDVLSDRPESDLSYEELLYLLESEECIAKEIDRFYAIVQWYNSSGDNPEIQLERLLEEVRFELMGIKLTDYCVRNLIRDFPKRSLLKIFRTSANKAEHVPHEILAPIQVKIIVPFSGILFAVGQYKLKENITFFVLSHWIMSVQFELNDEVRLRIDFKCERSQSILEGNPALPLMEELNGYVIKIDIEMGRITRKFSNSTTGQRTSFEKIISIPTDLSLHKQPSVYSVHEIVVSLYVSRK